MTITIRVSIFFPLLVLPFFACAQASSVSESLSVEVVPTVPGPNQPVTINVESYSFDISRSILVWTANGRLALQGTGERSFTFETGSVGTESRIGLQITSPTGIIIERTFLFPISGLDVIVEADTYTPPFYRGRTLPTAGAVVRFVAIPQSPVANLMFRWEDDFEFMQAASGLGRNVMSTRPNEFSTGRIYGVEVSSSNGSVKARRQINISYEEPEVVFYEESPLRGVLYHKALTQQIELRSKEITVIAEPYYFSTLRRESPTLTYEWTLNGELTGVTPSPSLTLRQDTEGEGSAGITLSIQSLDRLLQAASAFFTLTFGRQEL